MPYKDLEKERERLRKRRGTEKHKAYMREFARKRKMTKHGKERQAVADKKFRERHRDKFNLYQKNWLRKRKINNPDKALASAIAKRSRRLGSPIDRPPPRNCEACKKPFAAFVTPRQRIPQADHCHATGLFRGWLCSGCNSSLGFAEDSRDRLQLLIGYLDEMEIWR